MTITVTTTEQLLAMRGKDGVIRVEDDLRIECDVLWSVGKDIAGISAGGNIDAGGNIYARGNIYAGGYIDARGYISAGGYIYAGGNIDARGYISAGGNIDAGGYINVGGYIYAGGYIDARGYIDAGGNIDAGGYINVGGEYFICMGDLKWGHAAMPALPEKTYIRRVLPTEWQRAYWQDRLGIDISDGCYDEICQKVATQLINLLRDEKWTPTERWMLETLRDSENDLPDWVVEIRAEKGAA